MEVCLGFETSTPALPHVHLFRGLLCAFLSIDRPAPFASGKELGKPQKREEEEGPEAMFLRQRHRRGMQGESRASLAEPRESLCFAGLESGNSRSSPCRPWLYTSQLQSDPHFYFCLQILDPKSFQQ